MKFLFSILRLFSPEIAHSISLNGLKIVHNLGLINFFTSKNTHLDSYTLNNLTFTNRLGIAAGLDKNGDFIDALAKLGFGFIEVGTVTPVTTRRKPKTKNF